MVRTLEDLPAWTESAGGTNEWRQWVEKKTSACVARAAAWARKREPAKRQLPTRKQWRKAIFDALHRSGGRGHYSQFRLSLTPINPTAWNWPSVDHLKGPTVAELVLETRLVNDMKSIMLDEEFRALVGHLAAVLNIEVNKQENWKCLRSFAIEELPEVEPPMPV